MSKKTKIVSILVVNIFRTERAEQKKRKKKLFEMLITYNRLMQYKVMKLKN
jgi:hypothetical protein